MFRRQELREGTWFQGMARPKTNDMTEQHWPAGPFVHGLKFYRLKRSKRERERVRLELLRMNAEVEKSLSK